MRASTIARARLQQIRKSVPHYLRELSRARSVGDVSAWMQFKVPYVLAVPTFPPRVTIELTNRCNFGCPHCHRSVMKRGEGDIDFELFCKLADEICSQPQCIVKIGGLGEPSLYERFGDAMGALRDRRVRHITYTNGNVFERFTNDEILSWRIPHLIVSIDGTDANSYNRLRIGGVYDQLLAQFSAFRLARDGSRGSGPFLEVRHVIMPNESEEELRKFRARWMKVADTVMFNHLIPARARNSNCRRRCRDIRRELYVRSSGLIPFCGYQYLQTGYEWIGDLRTGSIRQAWNHERLDHVRHLHSKRAAHIPDFCRGCSQTA